MIASHIHDALAQVRELRVQILSKRNFTGYSGVTRILGGLGALIGAAIIAEGIIPSDNLSRLACWGGVLFLSLSLNYGALFLWFLFSREAKRDWMNLAPAAELLPPLAVGALLSVGMIVHQQYDLLYCVWMSCFGLAHLAHKRNLPKSNCFVGLFYIICGGLCLAIPQWGFANPWPMGVTFFIGELIGGGIFIINRNSQYSTR